MPVEMNTFWSDWGVACGNQSANNWYDCFYGLKMIDDEYCYNFQDFLKWNSNYWGESFNRYSFFKQYENIDPNILSERTFYQNTDDTNIFDFKTFYEYAPQYFPANCTPPVGNKFVLAYKNTNKPFISFDGINWNEITISLGDYNASRNCNVKGSIYVWMGGTSNVIRYNTVNDVWENFGVSFTIHDIAWNPDNNELIGITRDTTTNNVHISSDYGETWNTYSSSGMFDCIGYSEGNLKYYASVKGAGNKRVWTSSNGITWIPSITSTGNAITYDGRYFDSIDINGDIVFVPSSPITSGTKSYLLKTNNLGTWSQYEYVLNSDMRIAAFNPTNDAMIAMGNSLYNNVFNTYDVLNVSSAPTTYSYSDCVYFNNGSVFIAVTSSADISDVNKRILYSLDDGDNWIKVDCTTDNYTNLLVIE